MDKGIAASQCQTNGCAGNLLLTLRSRGCVVWGQVETPGRFGMPTALMITAESAGASAVALASDRVLTRHWQRMLMLLWAERGGRN